MIYRTRFAELTAYEMHRNSELTKATDSILLPLQEIYCNLVENGVVLLSESISTRQKAFLVLTTIKAIIEKREIKEHGVQVILYDFLAQLNNILIVGILREIYSIGIIGNRLDTKLLSNEKMSYAPATIKKFLIDLNEFVDYINTADIGMKLNKVPDIIIDSFTPNARVKKDVLLKEISSFYLFVENK